MPVNKVVFGNQVLIDLTSDTVNEYRLMLGEVAHDCTGEVIVGNFNPYLTRGDALLLHGVPTIFTDSYGASRLINYKTVTYQNGDTSTFTHYLGDNGHYMLYESYDENTKTLTKTAYGSNSYNFEEELGLTKPDLTSLEQYKIGERITTYEELTSNITKVTVNHNNRNYIYTITMSNENGVNTTTVESKFPET